MALIKQLPYHEAQKIAAGEVVDRPANVVKELIENSIDAQATQISIYIENGGKKLIRIVDNGYGMGPEDAHLCFEHHATSKITTVTDLDSIATFGFRGEALSSIVSVSNLTLNTQKIDAQSGCMLELEQATVIKEQSISRAAGTDIAVKDLFYNVPARKKFLKTRETEWRHIIQLFQAFCLAYQSIHFTLHADGNQIHNCPPAQSVIDRIAQLWDHHLIQHILELETIEKNQDFSIRGAISNHSYSRFDRSMIFLFVNNRWIKNFHLSRALLRGYNNVLQPAHYPIAFIFVSVEPHLVDINIHPRKEEVKFLHPRTIETSLQESIKQTLHNAISKQLHKAEVKHNTPSAITTQPIQPLVPAQQKTTSSLSTAFDFNKPVFIESQERNRIDPEEKELLQKSAAPQNSNIASQQQTAMNQPHKYHIIGQLNKTYILLEQEDGLFVIDQHAAHERILYEKFSKQFEEITTTRLLFPQIIKLSNDDISIIKSQLHHFEEKGIEIKLFGSNQLIVHATPVHLKNVNLENLVKQTIGWIIEYQHLDKQELIKMLNKKMHAKMSCSAAIKANDTLSMQEMQHLINNLERTENNLTCPHGRPTGWLLYKNEIEKKFKRDYRSQAA